VTETIPTEHLGRLSRSRGQGQGHRRLTSASRLHSTFNWKAIYFYCLMFILWNTSISKNQTRTAPVVANRRVRDYNHTNHNHMSSWFFTCQPQGWTGKNIPYWLTTWTS